MSAAREPSWGASWVVNGAGLVVVVVVVVREPVHTTDCRETRFTPDPQDTEPTQGQRDCGSA